MFIYLLIYIIYTSTFYLEGFCFLVKFFLKINAQNPSNQINNKDYKINTQYLLMPHKRTLVVKFKI